MQHRLEFTPLPERPRGLVLMLHGGAEHSERPVDHRSLALRRTRLMLHTLADRFSQAGIATGVLAFTAKGWNGKNGNEPSPVRDARAALEIIAEQHPDLPVILLGHSMGARTAVWVADQPNVVGAVGLAPWLPVEDPIEALAGKHLVTVHGTRDRITSPKATRRYVDRAAEVAASARSVDLKGEGHYMISGMKRWNRIALKETIALFETAGFPQRPAASGEQHLSDH